MSPSDAVTFDSVEVRKVAAQLDAPGPSRSGWIGSGTDAARVSVVTALPLRAKAAALVTVQPQRCVDQAAPERWLLVRPSGLP
jgi:hypothetical protein